MGILAGFLKRFRPLEIEDAFFGRLTYMKMPGGRVSYWEAKRFFGSSAREVELFIDAPGPALPPSELQREFFRTVERRYESISGAAESVLRPEFEQWSRKPLAGSFESAFTMTSFSIPNAPLAEAEWEVSFESRTDAGHLFTVSLKGERATGVSIDG